MTAAPMRISVLRTSCYLHNLHTRMPFRYGIASMTSVPHIFVVIECEIDGKVQLGVAADSLIPKWFTNDPDSAYRDDIDDMLAVIQAVGTIAQGTETVTSAFELWQALYIGQKSWASKHDHPPLLLSFGLSLIERAILDAVCRAKGQPLAQAIRENSLGIRLDVIHPELAGRTPADFLPAKPLEQLTIRHTVGLRDPIRQVDIPSGEILDDGLPQSLAANLHEYGLTHLKIKLSGHEQTDIDRLKAIAGLLRTENIRSYAFTLDGNEQFHSVDAFQGFWQRLAADPAVQDFLHNLLYVEQPLHRDAALCPATQEPLHRWRDRPLMIIDESDSQLDSLKIALDCGYNGVSHKNCKGIFKSIANACLLQYLKHSDPSKTLILSGEDLANIGPVALLQDLTMMAILGIPHVERNGHHYFAGLGMFPAEIQGQLLSHHPDLYIYQADKTLLNIQRGSINIQSCLSASFGTALDPNLFTRFTPATSWSFDTLAV